MDYIYTELDSDLIYTVTAFVGFRESIPTTYNKSEDECIYKINRGDILNENGVKYTYKIIYGNEPNTTSNITNIGRTFITQTKEERYLTFIVYKELGESKLNNIIAPTSWNIINNTEADYFICYTKNTKEASEGQNYSETFTFKFEIN